jgi:Cu(I)/Ag(I) efflux system membrane fusion protein
MMARTLTAAMALVLVTGCSALAADLPASLIDPYLKAQTLLAEDKTDGLAAAAKAIETAAAPLGKDGAPVAAGAKKLAAAATLDAARSAFGELSLALIAYSDASKAGLGKDLHVAYCPMADKPWVQKGGDIKNPYYGSEMLSCGVIKK